MNKLPTFSHILRRSLIFAALLPALLFLVRSASSAEALFLPRAGRGQPLPLAAGFAFTRERPSAFAEAPEPPTPEQNPLEQRARLWLESLSTRRKIGQLLLVRFPEEDAEDLSQELEPGGFVLFARDFASRSPDELADLLERCRRRSLVPPLASVDEEGGTVVRISVFPPYRTQRFLSPRALLRQGGLELVRRDAAEKAALLHSLGIQVNLGPVCDVADQESAFLYNRTAGDDAETVSAYVRAVVETSMEGGVGCVLKHFPGYGNNADTHVGSATDNRPLQDFEQCDFLPFAAGIEAGAGAVMVSHNIVSCMDPSVPASLSKPVHDLLRESLRFSGVCITDDLAMAAVAKGRDPGEVAVLALLAGNDLLCTDRPQELAAALEEALERGRIPEERLDEAVLRVLRWKLALGLLT